jgi:hypothetical protein
MADWKQIQARIRRARTSADPAGQLEKLFEKTRDAMAAFELARYFETGGNAPDAVRWYAAASENFRRPDWKKKAEEAAARLAGVPATIPVAGPMEAVSAAEEPLESAEGESAMESEALPEQEANESGEPAGEAVAEPSADSALPGGIRKRRRGRRGGRKHRRGKRETPALGAAMETPPAAAESRAAEIPAETRLAPPPVRLLAHELAPLASAESTGPGIRARSGDPALSSRLARLEMQLRRLLAAAPVPLEQADHAPAGPGVFIVTDADQTTYYYAESCATLRIGIGNLVRSGVRREGISLKSGLAKHLGIPESRAGKYVSEHCVVRWLQLDEGAGAFAHFIMAVLRPVLNE